MQNLYFIFLKKKLSTDAIYCEYCFEGKTVRIDFHKVFRDGENFKYYVLYNIDVSFQSVYFQILFSLFLVSLFPRHSESVGMGPEQKETLHNVHHSIYSTKVFQAKITFLHKIFDFTKYWKRAWYITISVFHFIRTNSHFQ